MRHPLVRFLTMGAAALAIGAGAGFLFLQAVPSNPPPPANMAPPPAAASAIPGARAPLPSREGTPYPSLRDVPPAPPPSSVYDRAKSNDKPTDSNKPNEGRKPSPRTKFAVHAQRIDLDEGSRAERMTGVGVPRRLHRRVPRRSETSSDIDC